MLVEGASCCWVNVCVEMVSCCWVSIRLEEDSCSCVSVRVEGAYWCWMNVCVDCGVGLLVLFVCLCGGVLQVLDECTFGWDSWLSKFAC